MSNICLQYTQHVLEQSEIFYLTEFRTKPKKICCFCTKFDQYAANNWNIMRFLQSVYSFMRDYLHFINICNKTQQNQELQHCKKLGNFNEIE
jgi:hypothetical protein